VGHVTLIFSCAACGATAHANPLLVMSIPARWERGQYMPDADGPHQPICEQCARRLLARFEREALPIPAQVRRPGYFERAYHSGPDESEI
jgi:hypothetical protein